MKNNPVISRWSESSDLRVWIRLTEGWGPVYPQITAASVVPTFTDSSPAVWAKHRRPLLPLLLVEVFAPWILPLSSSWVLLQFNQPSLILGQCRSQVKFSRAFVRSVHAWTACVVCDIVCRLRDWLESISAVAWFFKSVSLCTCPVSPSYKTNFQRHFLYTTNSVVIVTVTSVNVSHCCSL